MAAAAAAAAGAAAAAAALNDNDGNVVDGADLRADASFSDRIIATGRHPDFNPRAQLGDFCHDGEDLAFKPTSFIDGAGTPVGGPKNSYAQLGAAITIPARRDGIPVSYANPDAILALKDVLLTPNGAARGDTILQHMRKPGAPHPDTYKIGSYPVDELYLLTEEGGPMHRARAIIQDSCPFNAFVSKKTGQPLIGAGINGGTLELNNSIIKQLDGADAPSENSINGNMAITTEPNDFTVHMFLPGYRFRYLKVNDTTLQVHIIKLIGAAWTPICVVTCKAGISVNAVCQAAGVPPPRGTGKVKNALRVRWLEASRPEDREPALLLYIKTLTDWAQVYHGAKLWYDYHILEPVLSFDTFCKEAAVWLDTPMFLLASPKGFVDVMVCDPGVLEITDSHMASIQGKFTEAKGNPNTNIILNAIHDTAVRELRNIPYLLTQSNVYCYFMASEIDRIIGDITRRRDSLIADIANYPADINPAKSAAEIKAFYQKYFSLTTKSIYEYMVDLVQPIVKLTDKYESIHNRLTSAFSTWKQNTDSLIHQDEGKGAAQDDADATASALVARMIGIMQSAGAAATSETNGAWFSYLQLGGGAMGKTRPQRIMKMYQQLPADIGEHFVTYCAAHYKLDSAGIPKVGFARILGKSANGIEQKRERYTIVSPDNPVTSEGARLAARQAAEGGPIEVPLLGQPNIVAAATGTHVTDNRIENDNYSMSSEKYFKVLDARLLSILQIVQTIAEQGVEALTPPAAAAGAGAPAPPPPEKLALQIAALAAIDAATSPAPAPAAAAAAVGGAGGPAAPPAPAQPTSVFDSPDINIIKGVYDATCARDAVDRLTSVTGGTDEFTNVDRPYAEKVSTSFVGLPFATLRAAVNVTKLAGAAAVKAVGWASSMFGGIFCYRWGRRSTSAMGGAGGAAGPVELQGDSHIPIQVGGAREDGELEYCFKFYPNAPVMYTKRGSKTLMHAVMERMNTIFFDWNIADEAHIPFGSDIDRYKHYNFATVDSRDRFIEEIMEGDGIVTNGILEELYNDAVDSDMDTFYMAGLENLRILYRLYKEDNALAGDEFLEQLACYLFFSDEISEVFEREFSWRLEIKEICLQLIFWIQNPQIGAADPRAIAAKLAVARGSDEGFSAAGAASGGSAFSAAAGGGGGGGMDNSDDEDDSAAGGSSYEDDAFATLSKRSEAAAVEEAYDRLRAAQEARRVRREAAAAAKAAAAAMLNHDDHDGGGGGGAGGGGGGGGDDDNLNTLPPSHGVGAVGSAIAAAVEAVRKDAAAKARSRIASAEVERKAAAGGKIGEAADGAAAAQAEVTIVKLTARVVALRDAINVRLAERARRMAGAAARQRAAPQAAAAAVGGRGAGAEEFPSRNPSGGETGGGSGSAAAPAFAGLLGAGGGGHFSGLPPQLPKLTTRRSGSGSGSGSGVGAKRSRENEPTADPSSSALAGAVSARVPSGLSSGGGGGLSRSSSAGGAPAAAALARGLSGSSLGGAAAAAGPSRGPSGLSSAGSGGGGAGPGRGPSGSSPGTAAAAAAGAPPSKRGRSGNSTNDPAAAAAPSGGGSGMALANDDYTRNGISPTPAELAAAAAAVARPPGLPNPAFAAFAAPYGGGGGGSAWPPAAAATAPAFPPPGAAPPGSGGSGGAKMLMGEGGYRKPRRRSRKRSKHSSRRLTRRFG